MSVTSYAASGYLTIAEGAEYANLSKDMLRRAIAKGELKDTRIGRCQRVHRDRIDQWLATAPSSLELMTPTTEGGLMSVAGMSKVLSELASTS